MHLAKLDQYVVGVGDLLFQHLTTQEDWRQWKISDRLGRLRTGSDSIIWFLYANKSWWGIAEPGYLSLVLWSLQSVQQGAFALEDLLQFLIQQEAVASEESPSKDITLSLMCKDEVLSLQPMNLACCLTLWINALRWINLLIYSV